MFNLKKYIPSKEQFIFALPRIKVAIRGSMTVILACTYMLRFQNTVFIRWTLSIYSPSRKLKSFYFFQCLWIYISEQKVSLSPWFIWGKGTRCFLARGRITYRLRFFWKSQNQQNTSVDTLWAFQYCTIWGCAGPRKQISLPRWCCTKAITPHVIKKTLKDQVVAKLEEEVPVLYLPCHTIFSRFCSPHHPSCACTSIYSEMPSNRGRA